MTSFTKIDAIRKHLRIVERDEPAPQAAKPVAMAETAATQEGGKRVQKNLSLLERDAERLTTLAKRDGLSQARLLSAALDAYESQKIFGGY